VDTGDFRVRIPEDRKTAFAPYSGKEVVMGVRPEHIHAPEFAPPNITAEPVKVNVEVVELLGHELHLYLNSGKNSFVGTVDPRFGVHTGNDINVVFDMSNVHLFDKATELAIR
jgi:multiple sugar transport system ATP-binding protein